MPPYTAKVISDQELTDIYAYLVSRPHPPKEKAEQMMK
jgi:cytochrome c1